MNSGDYWVMFLIGLIIVLVTVVISNSLTNETVVTLMLVGELVSLRAGYRLVMK